MIAKLTEGGLTVCKPGYFDFISYAQLLTVTQVFQDPREIFVEASHDDQHTPHVVRRNAFKFPTSNSMYEHFVVRLGDILFDKLCDSDDLTFKSSDVYDLDLDNLYPGIEKLVNNLHSVGYCVSRPTLRKAREEGSFDAEFPLPAIMWGAKALHQRKAIPTDYDLYAMEALLRRAGYPASEIRTIWTKSSIIRQIRIA
jgi:hypothetical protein